jgi:SAM-dependent methyltransferase
MSDDYVSHVLDHYKEEAARHGTSAASTMWDKTTRGRELEAIVGVLRHLGAEQRQLSVLEVGCGNGVLLAHLAEQLPALTPTGLEFSPDMAALARGRQLPNAKVVEGDVRQIPFEAGSFDVVVSERCLINLMDRQHQTQAFAEIARVLRPGGHYFCVEAFTDVHDELNRAREELGLPAIPMAHHNLWFDKEWFRATSAVHFDVVSAGQGVPTQNFMSSHYFVSRVLYPAITKAEVRYNTAFVEFFSFLPPSGNFSPIQAFLLQRKAA